MANKMFDFRRRILRAFITDLPMKEFASDIDFSPNVSGYGDKGAGIQEAHVAKLQKRTGNGEKQNKAASYKQIRHSPVNTADHRPSFGPVMRK